MSDIDSFVADAIASVKATPNETPESAPEVVDQTTPEPAQHAAEPESLDTDDSQHELSSEISKEDAFSNKTVQNALSRKDRKNYKLQQQLNAANERLRQLSQKQPSNPPREEDFEGRPYSEFLAAHNKHAVESEFTQRDAKQARQEVEAVQSQIMQERKAHVDESEARVRDKLPDFDSVIDAHATQKLPNGQTAIPFSNIAHDVLQQSDEPALALYTILKSGNLNALNGASSHYEAASIIQQAIQQGKSLIKPRTQSKAPEPLTPARGTGTGAKSLSELSPDKLVERLLS